MSHREKTGGLVIAEKRLTQLKNWELRELMRLHDLLQDPNSKVNVHMRCTVMEIYHVGVTFEGDEEVTNPYDCGTVACIGGQIALAHGLSVVRADRYVRCGRSTVLHSLFIPDLDTDWGWDAEGRVAAVGIERFLAGSDKPWSGPPPVFADE